MLTHHVLSKKRTCIIRIILFRTKSLLNYWVHVDLRTFTHLRLRIPSEVRELPHILAGGVHEANTTHDAIITRRLVEL